MLVAILACAVGLIAVLVVIYREDDRVIVGPVAPDWGLLPEPVDVTRVEFPLTSFGYDPAAVEIHLDALAQAYADLHAVAPPEVRQRALQRAAMRRGVAVPVVGSHSGDAVGAVDRADPRSGGSALGDGDDGGLRAEAVLSTLGRRQARGRLTAPAE